MSVAAWRRQPTATDDAANSPEAGKGESGTPTPRQRDAAVGTTRTGGAATAWPPLVGPH